MNAITAAIGLGAAIAALSVAAAYLHRIIGIVAASLLTLGSALLGSLLFILASDNRQTTIFVIGIGFVVYPGLAWFGFWLGRYLRRAR